VSPAARRGRNREMLDTPSDFLPWAGTARARAKRVYDLIKRNTTTSSRSKPKTGRDAVSGFCWRMKLKKTVCDRVHHGCVDVAQAARWKMRWRRENAAAWLQRSWLDSRRRLGADVDSHQI